MIGLLELPSEAGASTDSRKAPRRYSTDRGDPGYPPWRLLEDLNIFVVVYLDGIELQDVVTADEGESLIIRWVRDAAGGLVMTPDRDIARETLRGQVSFAFRT